MTEKLTPKQEKFCAEYIKDGNATQAALRAGYSKKTARAIGCQNLAKPLIVERIKELTKDADEARTIQVKEALERLTVICRREQTDEAISPVDGSKIEMKIATRDQLKALELILKLNGMFEKNINLTGDLGINIEVDYGEES